MEKVHQNVKNEIGEKLRTALEKQITNEEEPKISKEKARINLSQVILSQSVLPTNNN